jgi:hypothetical protein
LSTNPNTNPTVPVFLDAAAVGRSSSTPFLTVFETRNPGTGDVNYPIQTRWVNTTNPAASTEWILTSYSNNTGVLTANWNMLAGGSGAAITLTGNTGAAVPPNGANTIFVLGDTTTINVAGNPGANTLTISTAGTVATSYVEDSGTAIPVAGVLNIKGGSGITTSGAGNTVTITNSFGNLTFNEDTGSATPSAGVVQVKGANGIKTTGDGANKITIGTTSGGTVITQVKNQVFTSSGTYTPSSGLVYASIQILGGGGAGGGGVATAGSQLSGGGGGGAAEYAVGIFTAAAIGASKAVTIGAGGVGVSGGDGLPGGNSSVGVLITAFGGSGGIAGPLSTSGGFVGSGGAGGTGGAGGDYRTPGAPGINGLGAATAIVAFGGTGASSQIGSGGMEGPGFHSGNNALGYGAGGGGANSGGGTGPFAGGNGSGGIVVVTEYIS